MSAWELQQDKPRTMKTIIVFANLSDVFLSTDDALVFGSKTQVNEHVHALLLASYILKQVKWCLIQLRVYSQHKQPSDRFWAIYAISSFLEAA